MATAEASSRGLLRPYIGPEKIIHTSKDTAKGESGRRRVKKISVEGGRRRYPQITIMLDYNGAEKGCSSAEKGVVMIQGAYFFEAHV